ncbi:O-antigen ligase family protein [Vibrio diabolicus]|uniref:O-antigen ligase family protein n=1 Tax=Vibrio diabolicus TaxID=50719 RepID=UPI00215E8EBF|nr:O-antigen ligase family protein [Vibrio diabolicus]MCR9568059.1 O-antigen ligase family protein [Vibrio alginolyticus]MCS0337810.1 O-antigen ligase family protein [Vibrio diabolicus]MCS0388461.1 O-antigen ligase family protein [Vibrio diabolicus]MCS0406236.1 O-antigen ligase family protein [Vibrio diabolicus]
MESTSSFAPTNSSAPSSHRASWFAACLLALFFIPMKFRAGGIALAPSDIVSLLSIGFTALVVLEGKAEKLMHPCMGFLVLFTGYVFLNGLLNRVPLMPLVIETVQWLAIFCLLSLMYAYGVFDDEWVMVYFTYLLFFICTLVALWHFAQGYQSGFKLLGVSKYGFGVLCSLLYLYRDKIRAFHLLMLVALVLLVLSQERKALLGFCLLFVFDQLLVKKLMRKSLNETYTWTILLALSFIVFTAVTTTLYVGFETLADTLEITQEDVLFANQSEARWVSNLHRKLLLANGLDILLQHPILGVGAKMLPNFMISYFNYDELAIYTHNFVLDTAIEYGLLGIALLFGGYFLFIRFCFRSLNDNRKSLLLAIYALIMVLFVAVNTTIILILLLPVMISMSRESKVNTIAHTFPVNHHHEFE